ncbi:hypothetical protein [Microviridae sp.]|nr:hypothetical protein [Microviridae sp.]UOF82362.1 hypothetical protein [Microviridae sp.]
MKTIYRQPRTAQTRLKVNNSSIGESIEQKMERIIANKEPIKDGAPLLFTERKEGVRASTNIRTDRFEVAVDAATKIEKSYKARREERTKGAKDGKAEPIQGKPETGTDKPTN